MKRILLIFLLILFSVQSSQAWSVKEAMEKIKNKYFNWVPSWHEVAFIVNIVSIYTKTRDIVYTMAYQVRLVQSSIRLIERQKIWFERTLGIMDQMRSRGFTLYELEQTFRDVAFLTGTHYQYMLYLSGRQVNNTNNFFGAFSNYTDPLKVPFKERMALNGALLGTVNTAAFALKDGKGNKIPFIYEANLGAITRARSFLAHGNSTVEDEAKKKKALFKDLSKEKETLNNSILVQQIAFLNLHRAQLKLNQIDALGERNKVLAYRILTKAHLLKNNEVFPKYRAAEAISGLK